MRWLLFATVSVPALAGVVATQDTVATAPTEDSVVTAPEPSRLFGALGLTLTSHYFFRGILQENQGLILQPSLELNCRWFADSTAAISSSTLTLGTWNSVHDGPTGARGDIEHCYESDIYAGLGVGLCERGKGSLTYTAYTSPNDAFPTVHEVALALSYDDSTLWGGGFRGVQPAATVALEFAGQADQGEHRGVYAELTLQPAHTIELGADLPLTLTASVTLGCSLHDYYERGGRDESFGYLDLGLAASLPLKLRRPRSALASTASLGAWSLTAGVDLMLLGDNTQAINTGDAVAVIGSVGLTCAF